jgi:hypothetical protein
MASHVLASASDNIVHEDWFARSRKETNVRVSQSSQVVVVVVVVAGAIRKEHMMRRH